jgi:hypothetical protein
MKHIFRLGTVSLLLALLASTGCQSVAPLPGAPAVAPWQKAFRKLNCDNPRTQHDLSTQPLLFAMTDVCRNVPRRAESQPGWRTLVAIDAANNEVRAVPIASLSSGGVHHDRRGDVVWYSGVHAQEPLTTRFLEAFVLRKGEKREVSLGRIDLPFIAGPGVWSLHGESCDLVSVFNQRMDQNSPKLSEHFLVGHDAPFSQARRLESRVIPLFWNPAAKYFVVQRGALTDPLPPRDAIPDRFGLDCNGEPQVLDARLQSRLAQVRDSGARFLLSSQGDLLATAEREQSKMEILLFRGDLLHAIEPPSTMAFCPDLGCDPFYFPLHGVAWSESGAYFMAEAGFDVVQVYRASDLKIVAQWKSNHPGDFPAHGFLNDQSAYELNDHSRMTFHQWSTDAAR